ncbi:MAG: transposase, partial [Pseudomonadota bacterium]
WRSANPAGIPDLVKVLREIGRGRELIVGMEPTGTYGDALRQALTQAGLTVHRVSGKATHDYAEIYDGVPSQHDGKDAAIVAELVSLGKSSPWAYAAASEDDQAREYWVERLARAREMSQIWMGRLEGLLTRHWPEVTRLLELNSVALVRALAHYGSPQRLREDAEAAARLRKWGGSGLSEEKIGEVLKSAWETVGIVPGEYPSRGIRDCAEALLELHGQRREANRQLEKLCEAHAVLKRHRRAVGACTASALWVWLGDPRQYGSGEAYRKAMGLNLKECSSGRHKGRLKITKRGPGVVRRFLYMAALRQVKLAGVRKWYAAKKARDGGRGGKGVVAVMRKLAVALHRVAVEEEEYDPRKLFPGSPLKKKRDEQKRPRQQRGTISARARQKGSPPRAFAITSTQVE